MKIIIDSDELMRELTSAQENARRGYEHNKASNFDAGRYDGIKQAIEIVDAIAQKSRAFGAVVE